MNKLILTTAVSLVATIASASAPVYAATVTGNQGSNITVTSCADIVTAASNNAGSNVTINGGGNCNINQVLKSAVITGNAGSNVTINGVCGDASAIQAVNNQGSNVRINSNGACTPAAPTTVKVTPKPAPAPVQAPSKSEAPAPAPEAPVEMKSQEAPASTPAALPNTGSGTQTVMTVLVGSMVLAYATYYLRALRFAKEA